MDKSTDNAPSGTAPRTPGLLPYSLMPCLLTLLMLVSLWLPAPSRAETPPLLAHTGWTRLDALASELPFAWARRYLELKSIAEDADAYSQQLPPMLQRLHEVTSAAQKDVVTLLLDMVPAQANVQETSYILGLLENWSWKLEAPLHRTASTAAGIQSSQEVLASIGQAVTEMQANPQKRPIMEKASQDFYDLYNLVHQQVQQLDTDLNAVRSVALGLFNVIEKTTANVEEQLPQKWVSYYTSPLIVSKNSLSRLGVDTKTMVQNWIYDEEYPSSLPFATIFNILVLFSMTLLHLVFSRIATAALQISTPRTFMQSLCCEFYALSKLHKLAFAFCIVVMLNSIVDTLPQFHEGIPFLFVPQIGMAVAMAFWTRENPADPQVWELALPIVMGLLLLHGDAGPMLIFLCMGGAMLVPLVSLLVKSRGGSSPLRNVWITGLLLCLLLLVMGFGRLTVPLLMLLMAVRASAIMLRVLDGPALEPYMLERAWFVPAFTLFLFFLSISFLVACSGLGMLRNYWYANAIPIFGFSVTFGDAILTVLFLLGVFFASNISRQVLENLSRDSRVLDASAVPVLHVTVNCILLAIFGCFVMSALGMDVSSLAFIGGGVSIGIGFAAKTILSNFFCGLVIIFSKVVRADDTVEINGVSGKVLSVNMRATVVETSSNGILLVPNEEILDSRLTNWSMNNRHIREDILVRVAPESDMDATIAAMEDAASRVSGVLKSPQPEACFMGFGEDSMDIALKIWVDDVRNKDTVLSEMRKVLTHTLAEHQVVLAALVTRKLDVNICQRAPTDFDA